MTFRVQPAVITRICDGCRTESDPVDLPVLREQGWTLAPGGPYDHPVPALDWCPNCTTIRSDLAAAIALVRERAELRFGIPAVQGTYQAGYAAAMDDILRALEGETAMSERRPAEDRFAEEGEGVMDRRPHWDDDLVEAVRSKIGIQFGYNPFDDEVYNVIAAVEDWQAKHPEPYVEADTDSLHRAEAAIQRVLEACKAKQGPQYNDDPYNRGWDNALLWIETIVGDRA